MTTQAVALKSGEVSSSDLETMNPFDIVAIYNPKDQTTETLIAVNRMLGQSFKDYFQQAAPWLLELKYNRFKVAARSKGVQVEVDGKMVYWHEFFAETFDVTTRHFQQLERQARELNWCVPDFKAGDRVKCRVSTEKKYDTFEAEVVSIDGENVDVRKTDGTIQTVSVYDAKLLKEAPTVRITGLNQLVICMDVDGGAEYEYVGGGQLRRTDSPTVKQQQAADALAALAKEEAKQAAKLSAKRAAIEAGEIPKRLLSKPKRWYKVGADSRTLSIGSGKSL
jgi:hypothetical protein